MKKVKSFMLGKNPSESEVVDTTGDIIETIAVVEDQLEDGFQILDLLKIADQEDEVRDVINSFPAFLKEFKEINPELARQAVESARKRAIAKTGKLGKIADFAIDLMENTSSSYAFVAKTVADGKEQLARWDKLFKKGEKGA